MNDYGDIDDVGGEPSFVTWDQIDKLIQDNIPDRSDNDDWLDVVISEVSDRLPPAEAKATAARMLVKSRLGRLIQNANNALRKWHRTGQWPLDLMDLARLPMALDGNKTRVRFGAATSLDLTDAILYQARIFARAAEAHGDLVGALDQLIAAMGERHLTVDALISSGSIATSVEQS